MWLPLEVFWLLKLFELTLILDTSDSILQFQDQVQLSKRDVNASSSCVRDPVVLDRTALS
jgi:hypothetical protein